MTLDELRAHLNALRTDESWRASWRERGYDPGSVIGCLRVWFAEAEKWSASDSEFAPAHYRAWVKHIVMYANGELPSLRDLPADYTLPTGRDESFTWEEPRRIVPQGDPEYDGDEGKETWMKYVTSCNPQKTFAQAMNDFQRLNGYWPKRDWPGCPKRDIDRYRRICAVDPERLNPGLPKRDDGPIPD